MALARKSLVDFAEVHQLWNREKSVISSASNSIFHVVAIELSSMVFKRSVFESRKRPQGYLRPKVRVEFATLLQHSWPRTITERYLNQLNPNPSAQILAILEALSLKPGERRSLISPKPPVDSSDWEMSDVYTELFIASMELIYPNSSKKLIPNFLSGAHVIRKIPVDREKTATGLINHTIALNETKFLRWTQLDLIHYQYNYRDFAEELDENGELSSESKAISSPTTNANISCTIDSLMKLIQIYFACAQYDIFDLISRDTLNVFEVKLSDLIQEQAPKECTQYVQAQIDTLELLRALHSAQLSRKVLNKNEIIEDVLQQPNVQESQAVNLSKSSMKQQDTSNLATDFLDSDKEANPTRLLQNQTLILSFLPKGVIKLVQKLDNFVRKKDELQISMYDNAIFVDIIVVLWDYCYTLCQKWFNQSKLKVGYFNTIKVKLIGILYLFSLMKTLFELLNIDVADGLMSCNLIFYVMWIMEMFEQKLFVHHNSRKESSQNSLLDSMDIKLILKALTLQMKPDDVCEWLTWCDLNEMSKENVDKKIKQMDESSLKQCGRNKMSKVFYYCLKAETEVNNETAKKYYQIAEKLLFNKWSNESHSIASDKLINCQRSTGLNKPDENIVDTEKFRSDRPPPPILVAKCENSMVFQTQKWNLLSGEQVICNNGSSVLKVTNLTPNEEYAFAVAAYNEEGHPVGQHKHGLGHSTKPILAYSSLCIYTGLCHLLQIQKIHLSEKLLIGLELSAKLNDVQLLLDFADLIYETLTFNIEMSSVTYDYAKILLKSLTIILGVRKCIMKLLLDEILNRKLTQIIIKFTFGLIKVFEVLNELKGVVAILKIVKVTFNQLMKDIKPSLNLSTKKRISQGKLSSSYLTGRRKSRQNIDQMDELNSAIKTIDAYSYLVTAKLNPPRGELFGYEDEYQAIACMATKPIKAAIKDVIKFNRRTIFLQLVNVILERVHVSQINLIQPCLNEIRTWLNHRDQLLIKSCHSYETTDIIKLNDNMNATSLDKTKSAAYKASQAILDYLGSFVQEHLCDTNNNEKNDKNQCPVMENEHEINEDFIDTQFILKLPDNIKNIFDFIKRSTNLGYRAKCWPKVYDAAKFCWNATSLLSSLLCRLLVWCNEAKIRRETDVKVEANIKITNKNSRKGINTDGEKYPIQTQVHNNSVSEIMNYLKQYTNRRALANIGWSCWFMSADNILDLVEVSLNQDENTVTKPRCDAYNFVKLLTVGSQILDKTTARNCLIIQNQVAFGKQKGILPFIIFGQNQIMKRLKEQKTMNTTINDVNNIEQLNRDFSNLVNRSQIQLYSALYHYNFIQPKSEEIFTLKNSDFFNNCKSDTFGISLKSKQFLELMNQCRTFKKGTFPWTKDTVIDKIEKPNINWIDFSQQENKEIKPLQPKIYMNGWLIPQSHLKDDQLISNTKSMSEEETALCNIFLPLNSHTIEDELKEAESLHYSGIMNKMDQARLYQSLELVDLQNYVSQWERKCLFVTNSKEGLGRKTYENLIHHTIKFYNEALVEKNIVRLLYEMENQTSTYHSNFQAHLKELLFNCGSDICQIIINSIRDKNSFENCKTLNHSANVTQKQTTQQDVLGLWFRCRAELVRCQIYEVDGGRIIQELPETENYETPKENENIKMALEEAKLFKSKEYLNEFTLLNNQLLFIRNKLGNEKITNIMIEEISLTRKCNQLLAHEILRENDSVVQELFQNILLVNDDNLFIKLEDILKILLNVQKILIKENNQMK
ncbi:hypothetical protein Smp_125990 [Schistosoma mansoni]|uniref:hypothetical protein n=1 Tax=Schistosoma mansoni TaxID=6183 RepID=UPI00022DBEC9|nr:hypothetical protein Smp_125990 [Schistosoma mansoni]|eukprot:XP_018648470.1 hypothetical protein Smp_125990 [Schistosoma mansoni]